MWLRIVSVVDRAEGAACCGRALRDRCGVITRLAVMVAAYAWGGISQVLIAADEVRLHVLASSVLQERIGTGSGAGGSGGAGGEGAFTGPRLHSAATVRFDEGVELRIVQIGTPVRPELENQERVQLAALVAGVEVFEEPMTRGMTQLAIAGLQIQRVAPAWTLTLTPEGLLFRASVRVEDLAGTTQQLIDVMREAPFDEQQFEMARQAAIDKRVQLEASAQQAVGDLLARQMSPTDDPRLRRATAENFRGINARQAHAFLKLHFASRRIDFAAVSTARLASVLSSMEPQIRPLLTSAAGERLIRQDGPADLRRPVRSVGGQRQVIQSGAAGMPGQMLVTFTQPAPAQGEIMASARTLVAARAMQEELRQALASDGGTGAKLAGVTPVPGRTYSTLGVTVMTFLMPAPATGGADGAGADGAAEVASAIAKLNGLIDQAGAAAASDERVAKARGELAKEQRRRLSQFEHLATVLATGRYVGLGVEDVLRTPERLEGVTASAVQEVLNREFAGASRSVVVLQPSR